MDGMSETRKAIMARLGFAAEGKSLFAYADAQVSGGDIVWPSGLRLKIVGHSTLEQKSPKMQEAIKRNKSAWVADYQLRGPKGATYTLDLYSNGTYILTPHNRPGSMLRGKLSMARLGFAAGEKAAFAITKEQIRGASREELRSIEQRLMALAKSGDKNAAALLDYVEEEYNDRYRSTHSRPGAKEEMGRAEQVMRDGSVHLDFRAAKEWLSAASDTELRYIAQDSRSAFNAQPEGKKANYYRDLVLAAQQELKKRGFSRPGAKSTHASPDDISKMAQLLSRVESAVINKRMDEARSLLKQIAPIVDRNRGDNELDSQGMVRAFNEYKRKLGFSKSTHAADGFYGDSEAEAVRHMSAEATAEDIKYGDKIKMATDPAVGKKISKLMDEGYPQQQAIAIALDMKRKGEI